MATLPDTVTVNLPGRILLRTGLETQVPGAALRLGEGAYTTDGHKFYIGDESNSPAWIPTTDYAGALPWDEIDVSLKSITVDTINGKSVSDFVSTTIINSGQVLSIINEGISKTVYGAGADFADWPAAMAWLSQRTISSLGFVTLVLPAIKIVENRRLSFTHPNGDRINVIGAPLKAPLPQITAMTLTGNSNTQRTSDNATNLTALRACFATEFAFTNGGGFDFNAKLNISNILCTFDGSRNNNQLTDGIVCQGNSSVTFTNVASTGANYRGLAVIGGGQANFAADSKNYFFGNGGDGVVVFSSFFGFTYAKIFAASNGMDGTIPVQQGNGISVSANSFFGALPAEGITDTRSQIVSSCNRDYGFYGNSSTISLANSSVSNNNGLQGVNSGQQASFYANAMTISGSAYGIIVDGLSLATVLNSTISASTTGITANNGSFVIRTGSTVTAGTQYSPALNTPGNNNAYIS